VLAIIKPNFIFFISTNAWKNYDRNLFDKKCTGHSCHPTMPWNKKSADYTKPNGVNEITGKESFEYFIKKNVTIQP
jgi:hypothetical protein